MAGAIVTEAAARKGVAILPVDSEHNAIHQCLHGRTRSEVRRLILTASGGPFRGRSASDMETVSAGEALNHPTWRMGRKITIDSATLMNKGSRSSRRAGCSASGPIRSRSSSIRSR